MSEQSPSLPKLTTRTAIDKAARADRLAAEMRKNLMKRKRQQREKTTNSGGIESDDAGPEDRS